MLSLFVGAVRNPTFPDSKYYLTLYYHAVEPNYELIEFRIPAVTEDGLGINRWIDLVNLWGVF